MLAAIVRHYVRWGALKRFFDAEDSIFANNKNFLLRHFTAWLFKNIGALPIDREKENWAVLKEIHKSLRAGLWLGFFPEGTTNKNPGRVLVQEPKKSIFAIAKATGALIQPVALTWLSQEEAAALAGKNRFIVNFRPAWPVEDLDAASKLWMDSITEGILENRQMLADAMKRAQAGAETAVKTRE